MSTPLELLFDPVFAIWWARLNYTWFASAYAVDDVLFRLLTFVIMGGALTLAAGVPGFFADGQSGVLVAGYAIMRVGMAALWLRAARHDPAAAIDRPDLRGGHPARPAAVDRSAPRRRPHPGGRHLPGRGWCWSCPSPSWRSAGHTPPSTPSTSPSGTGC
ncbi:low temperature requirement protein A [Janibacter limosus]|nr:low temperature requirement protein A [Janibacter limosus]WKV15956.1 low temperature requirement protein A [Janibacter limosus]